MPSKIFVKLKSGISPLRVSTPSQSVLLIPEQVIEVEYDFYRAHLMDYATIVTSFPKPVIKPRGKKSFIFDEE